MGLKDKGSAFHRGTILAPAKGKTYKAKARLIDGGNKLGVPGWIAFICRKQVKVRKG